MSLQSADNKNGPFTASTDTFPCTFKIFAEDEIIVTLTNPSDINSVLVLNSDYTVSGISDTGFTVTTTQTYGSTYQITVTRNITQTQEATFKTQGPREAVRNENAHDKAMMAIQELTEKVDRAVKVPVNSTENPDDYLELINSTVTVNTYTPPEKRLSSYLSLADAITSIASNEVTLVIDKDDTMTGNITVPSNVVLRSVNGNTITTNSNTLTIQGSQELPASIFSDFAADVANISVPNGITIVVDTDVTLTSALTIDALIGIRVLKGNIISLGAYNLTINGVIDAGLYKVFDDSGAGAVAGPLGVDEVYPQWWGALGDGINDDSIPIQSAIEASARTWGVGGEWTGAVVKITGGRYVIGSTLTIQNNAGVSLVGQGKTKSNLIAGSTTMTVIDMGSSNNARTYLHGLRIHGGSAAQGVAINIGTAGNQIDVRDCWIDTIAKGLQGSPTSDSYVTDCTMEFVSRPIILANSNDMTISCNTFVDCGPIALGVGSFDPLFDFDTCERIGMFDNRIIATSGMSNTPSGIVRVSSCNDFIYRGNINNAAMSYIAGPYMNIVDSDRVVIDGNVFGKSYNENLLITDSTDVIVSSNTFIGTNQAAQITLQLVGVVGFAIRGNTFQDNGGLYDLQVINGTSTTENGTIEGNVFDLGYNLTPLSGPIYIPPNIGGSTRNYLTAAPTAGTWKRGDVVYHQQPSASGNMGWVCVTAGTPGTWKSWGTISA